MPGPTGTTSRLTLGDPPAPTPRPATPAEIRELVFTVSKSTDGQYYFEIQAAGNYETLASRTRWYGCLVAAASEQTGRRRGRPPESERAQRRDEALDAALAEIRDVGYERVTMQAVARRARLVEGEPLRLVRQQARPWSPS